MYHLIDSPRTSLAETNLWDHSYPPEHFLGAPENSPCYDRCGYSRRCCSFRDQPLLLVRRIHDHHRSLSFALLRRHADGATRSGSKTASDLTHDASASSLYDCRNLYRSVGDSTIHRLYSQRVVDSGKWIRVVLALGGAYQRSGRSTPWSRFVFKQSVSGICIVHSDPLARYLLPILFFGHKHSGSDQHGCDSPSVEEEPRGDCGASGDHAWGDHVARW